MDNIILLTGRCKSGKDYLADYLVANYGYVKFKFATALLKIVSKLYDIELDEISYERFKDTVEAFPNLPKETLRATMIYVAEEVLKPVLGRSIFSECLANSLVKTNENKIVISDLGFEEELNYFQWRFDNNEYPLIEDKTPLYCVYISGGALNTKDSREDLELYADFIIDTTLSIPATDQMDSVILSI